MKNEISFSLPTGNPRHIPWRGRIPFAMDWQLIVPEAKELAGVDLSEAREIRLRPGQPVTAWLPAGVWRGSHRLSPAEVSRAAQALSGHALAARREAAAAGFVPLPGGHRLGICGCMGPEGLREITSLCVRMAHEVKGVGEEIFAQTQGKSTLILGAPGTGKTTLLRDLIRLYAESGAQVGVADERGEIAACWGGAPQLDIGPSCDVVTGMEKGAALLLLLRSMAPQVVATDELGGAEDARAVLEALRCGAVMLATLHAGSLSDGKKRRGMASLLKAGAFERAVVLRGIGLPPEIKEEIPSCI